MANNSFQNTAALSSDIPATSEITVEDYHSSVGETLHDTLDLNKWTTGGDLPALYERLTEEIQSALEQENRTRKQIQDIVFPRIKQLGAPKGAGVYKCKIADIERVHRGLLFNGAVEACDGTRQMHDTLPLTIFQIGVSLVSYKGNQGTWGHRLFRRDLRVTGANPIDEALELLDRRSQRGGQNQPSARDKLSDMLGRAIMAYAERALLLRRSDAAWRMGHGSPAPYELVTGSGSLDLMIESTKVIRELVEGHQKFVYVASEPSNRLHLTIGQALDPLQFAIIDTLNNSIDKIIENGHYGMKVKADMTWDGKKLLNPWDWIKKFRNDVASQVVVGVYRASAMSPPQLFYAHQDHFDMAAHIAIADSVLQEHRGFPMLIDLADNVCRSVFGGDTFSGPIANAYGDSESRYLSERSTRK